MEEEKRYKIEKVEKLEEYGKEWNYEKNEVIDALRIGIISITSLVCGTSMLKELAPIMQQSDFNVSISGCVAFYLTTLGGFISVESIIGCISSMVRKAKLEKKIDEIDAELNKIEKMEKSRGGK